jgi:hypothetical protein
MDLCSLEDAFPNIESGSVHPPKSDLPYVGGNDSYSSKEERRAARKMAKKAKMMLEKHRSPDPDRPAVERMEPVETVTEQKEAFVSPVLPKASCIFTDPGTPPYFGGGGGDSEKGQSYFGAWGDDDLEEHFSGYSSSPREDINYRLQPDFTKSEQLKGAAKAASQPLPEPPLTDSWKPLTPGASYTSYFTEVPKPKRLAPLPGPELLPKKGSSASEPLAANDGLQLNNQDALIKRIDQLMGRLEQLEKKSKEDSQTEILMFVGTGLFLLMSFEIFGRR